jgi:hypothetical protein
VPSVMSVALVSLLVVGAGWCTLLCSGSETAVVSAEGGCYVISGGGSAVLVAVPVARVGISSAGAGILGTGVGVPGAGTEAVLFSAE